MPDYHYTHPILWAVASIPIWLAVVLWIRIRREDAKRRRLRRRYVVRLMEYAARYEGDVDDDTPLDKEIYDEAYREAMERKKVLP